MTENFVTGVAVSLSFTSMLIVSNVGATGKPQPVLCSRDTLTK